MSGYVAVKETSSENEADSCGMGRQQKIVLPALNFFPVEKSFSSPVSEVVSSSKRSVTQTMELSSVCSMNTDLWLLYLEIK